MSASMWVNGSTHLEVRARVQERARPRRVRDVQERGRDHGRHLDGALGERMQQQADTARARDERDINKHFTRSVSTPHAQKGSWGTHGSR